MKNLKVLAIGCFAIILSGCGTKLPKGQKQVDLPCFQDKYTPTKKDYIASGRGISIDQVTSRKKALLNAKQEIAGLIRTNIRSLTDDYTLSRTINNREELKSRFETITSEVVDEMLMDIDIKCQELGYDKKLNQYNTYVALSISKDDAAKNIVNKLSKKDKEELDLDYEKFRSLLDKEINN